MRRTVRSRCDCADNVWTERRTRVDANDARGQCATHRSQTYLVSLVLYDRCDAQFYATHLWVSLALRKRTFSKINRSQSREIVSDSINQTDAYFVNTVAVY